MKPIYITVCFSSSKKSYYFSTDDKTIKVDDKVIVETVVGKELGTVTGTNLEISEKSFAHEIKPIISKATIRDIEIGRENEKLAHKANQIFLKSIEDLKLDMRLISSEYTFDRTKILFIYSSDDRVDFRELLKILANELHCRIELRQINSRERAQSVGGIGVCGLQLCCTTFFKTFDGISLNRAKNQMLAINIPKLSGQCGKLMCCLKYEDDMYTEIKKSFPKLGATCRCHDKEYKISGYNILTKVVKIENEDSVEFVKLEEIQTRHEK